MKSSIAIAQEAKKRPIMEIAAELGLPEHAVEPYGRFKAKVSHRLLSTLKDRPSGKLIMLTGITPTPAGEGKTTVTIGLSQALRQLGKQAVVALREPSMGPVFAMKGGAAGGGIPRSCRWRRSTSTSPTTSTPSPPLTTSSRLLSTTTSIIGTTSRSTPAVSSGDGLWTSDRALRNVILGLGGALQGVPRETWFDIAAASEIMAILCLSESLKELKERLARILIGYTYQVEPVRVGDLGCQGALAVLLKDALDPNLVQTLEGGPALVHGGPFGNIAHGCNSVLATKLALKLGDYAVTEAGFGFDLGGEKFLDIKCPYAGLKPEAIVVVATARALKMRGGVSVSHI